MTLRQSDTYSSQLIDATQFRRRAEACDVASPLLNQFEEPSPHPKFLELM
jgi:hypothetical protein